MKKWQKQDGHVFIWIKRIIKIIITLSLVIIAFPKTRPLIIESQINIDMHNTTLINFFIYLFDLLTLPISLIIILVFLNILNNPLGLINYLRPYMDIGDILVLGIGLILGVIWYLTKNEFLATLIKIVLGAFLGSLSRKQITK